MMQGNYRLNPPLFKLSDNLAIMLNLAIFKYALLRLNTAPFYSKTVAIMPQFFSNGEILRIKFIMPAGLI